MHKDVKSDVIIWRRPTALLILAINWIQGAAACSCFNWCLLHVSLLSLLSPLPLPPLLPCYPASCCFPIVPAFIPLLALCPWSPAFHCCSCLPETYCHWVHPCLPLCCAAAAASAAATAAAAAAAAVGAAAAAAAAVAASSSAAA